LEEQKSRVEEKWGWVANSTKTARVCDSEYVKVLVERRTKTIE